MAKTGRPVAARKVESKSKGAWGPLVAVCVLVIGVYAYAAQSGGTESLIPNAAETYYNLLVRGFRAGQLNLKKEVPPGLARLSDPYDPATNEPYRSAPYGVHDMSYYKGKLYLYFGVTPALILFWPFVALTDQYLFQSQAVAVFCTIGFLVSVGLLRALWRRYFAEVSVWVVAACMLALGLATGVPILASGVDVYQVPIGCGYMLTMLALAAIWCALHEPLVVRSTRDKPGRRWRWLAAASVAYGLAIGARPSLLLGAVILLVPVAQAWRERRQVWTVLIAATGPIMLIGLGLMLYNSRRFDSPFEFGQHYQLAASRVTQGYFSLRYLWFNFLVYFLEPARWGSRFPFVHEIVAPTVPPGHGGVERAFGILTNIPLVWLALAAPLAWRRRPAEAGALRGFVMAVALLFGMCAFTLGIFWAAISRYEIEILPALVLLAVVGILGLERELASTSELGQPDRPGRRRAARWGWSLLLGFSVAFNLLTCVVIHASVHYEVGSTLLWAGRVQEAIGQYQQALRLQPDYAEAHYNLGIALGQAGSVQDAIVQYEQAVRFKPDFTEAYNNLGIALAQTGRIAEAIPQFERTLRINPEHAGAHYNLGTVLEHTGKRQEAVEQYEQALRFKPDFTEARTALTRLQAGQ